MKKSLSAFALACLLTVGLSGCAAAQDWWDDMMGDEARTASQSESIS